MERFCGHLKHGGAGSKRFPYKSLDRYLFDWTILWHIGAVHDLRDTLKLGKQKLPQNNSNSDNRLEVPGCKFNLFPRALIRLCDHTDNGYVLMVRRPLSVPATSQIFLLVLEDIMRYFPEPRADLSVVWRVRDALAAAKFSEWTRFTKGNSQDTFYSSSRYSRKAGARDSRYARVSRFPRQKPNCQSLLISTRLSNHR
jgi:hypothetical protein